MQLNATSPNSVTSNLITVQGPRGRDGRDGLPGRDGRDGTPGRQGESGATGLQGPRGPQGTILVSLIPRSAIHHLLVQ